MELQIQDLVSSIRKEGIEAANAEAESIIAEAKKKAESILNGAKVEAQQYKDSAEKEIGIPWQTDPCGCCRRECCRLCCRSIRGQ